MTETSDIYSETTYTPIFSEYDTTVEHVSSIVFYGFYAENLIENELPDVQVGLKDYIDKWLATSDEDNNYYSLVVENFQKAIRGYLKHFEFFNLQNGCFIDVMYDVLEDLRYKMLRNHYTYYQCEKTIHNLRDSMMSSISPDWEITEFVM